MFDDRRVRLPIEDSSVMQYRPEIDGLRAVAVLPVIFFHAGFSGFEGGYVGVDVFFVISGYLITSIILSDRDRGDFSYARFYERRARRILPALFLVVACCTPAAIYWLRPDDLVEFFSSVATVAIFSSNIFFWQEADYFASAAEMKPLLHSWSLAVEEQFYLIFPPLLLVFLGRSEKLAILAIGLGGAASLALAHYSAFFHPVAGFYLLPTRAWELAIGVLIALHHRRDGQGAYRHSGFLAEASGIVGVAMIITSVFVFDRETPFPSLYSLIPTLGTALIILWSTEWTIVGKLLSTRALVHLGLVSYSSYLWHQPLFAFYRHQLGGESVDVLVLLSLVALTLILAHLTWRYVERPFRDRAYVDSGVAAKFSVLGLVFFLGLGGIGAASDGWPRRFSALEQELLQAQKIEQHQALESWECDIGYDEEIDLAPDCTTHSSEILIWGDSYASSIVPGFKAAFGRVSALTASGCPPLLGIIVPWNPRCEEINQYFLRRISESRPSTVVLVGHWIVYENLGLLLEGTINRLSELDPSVRIVVMGNLPEWTPELPRFAAESRLSLSGEASLPLARLNELRVADLQVRSVVECGRGTFVPVIDLICVDGYCPAVIESDDGFALTSWDGGHLSIAGAKFVMAKVLEHGNVDF